MRATLRLSVGFSLLELVIVVVILGIVAAIAIPRMSRGSEGAKEAALKADLVALREAIERYRAEHDGQYPPKAKFKEALTQYSNQAGTEFQAIRDSGHYYGPYIDKIPPVRVGGQTGSTGVSDLSDAGIGWIYDETAGAVRTNTTDAETDAAGKRYNGY